MELDAYRRTIVDFKQFITFQLSDIEGSSIELDCLSCVGSILKIDFQIIPKF